MEEHQRTLKVILVGDSFSGKTSLLEKYIYGKHDKYICTTISPDFKISKIGNTTLQIWDIPGLERYRKIILSYLKLAKAAVILFDATDNNSFINAKLWLDELNQIRLPNNKIYLVANKIDLGDRRVISKEVAEMFADRYGLKYLECSAKSGENINNLFENIAQNSNE